MKYKSNIMDININNNVLYLTFKEFDKYKFINHAFSTKIGGISQGEFSSMNLGFNRGDPRENVIKNYHLFCDAAGFDYESLVASSQDHNTNIRVVNSSDRGIGIYREHDMESVDGLVTNKKDVTLVTYYADCTPLFFIDPAKKVVGLAHAGWRGTVKKIGKVMVDKMLEIYGSDKSDIVCAIGPAIGFCCFEVDYPVFEIFSGLKDLDTNKFIKDNKNGKYMIDLHETNKQILIKAGIPEDNIIVSDICTKCSHELLFSHRETKGRRGGMAAMISLKDCN